jgi:phage terminase large subunit GpA-like protein
MGTFLANPERLAMKVLVEILTPPPIVDYIAWAEQNIVFSERESAFNGPYNRRLFTYNDEILKALSPEDPCRVVTIMKSAQIGGTVLANIFVGGSLCLDPSNIMYIHPTEDNAKRWSRDKLSLMIKGTPALLKLFSSNSKEGSDSILYKERADGRGAITISGANSPASLSQVTMRRQVQDDLAQWDINTAGDPESQADSRSRAFEFAKILKISTPLIQPGCRITKSFEAGSQEYPYIACPHCQHMQVLEWQNMLSLLDEEKPEDACFSCTSCGALIEEHHRPDFLKTLTWVAKNQEAKRHHRSFWIWSAYSYLQSFETIAREWLAAKGDPAKERVFSNNTTGQPYSVEGHAPPWEKIKERAETSHYVKGQIPVGFTLITMGMDCQDDRVEWQVVAWGRQTRRAVIDYGVVPGHISDLRTQELLGGLLQQTWVNSVGRRINIDMAAIDGNAWTEDVFSFVRRHPASKLIMVRGVGSDLAPLFAPVKKERHRISGKLLAYRSRFYNFAASVIKMTLYRNIIKDDNMSNGAVLFPRGLSEDYFKQLTSESRVPVKTKQGFTVYRWEKDPALKNEALDTMCQAYAAAYKAGLEAMTDVSWGKLEHEREKPLEHGQLDLEDMMSMKVTGLLTPSLEADNSTLTIKPEQQASKPYVMRRRVSQSSYMHP